MDSKYREYFDIDEEYFSQISDSSIKKDPDLWRKTYPHQTFIEMLNSTSVSWRGRRSVPCGLRALTAQGNRNALMP